MNIKFIIVILLLQYNAVAETFFGAHSRGWHWYETLPIPQEEEDTHEHPVPSPQSPKRKTPKEVMSAYREELENRLSAAWIHPTPQNIQAYQEMQKDMTDRSQVFSTVWMHNVIQNPALDHTLVAPVNQKARHLHLDLEKERTQKTIKSLSQTHGLFFFFSGKCAFCHQFAPIVKMFSELYGWEVIAISVDGGSIEEFPNAERDNGLFREWNIQVLPALYAVNPQAKEAIPIAYGLTSIDEMEQRIMTIVGGAA